jgi:hypothetical protein
MSDIQNKMMQRLKFRAYKNEEQPDSRESLCGEPGQVDPENGRTFFEVPDHQKDYLSKLLPSYEMGESYDINDGPATLKPAKVDGRRRPRE